MALDQLRRDFGLLLLESVQAQDAGRTQYLVSIDLVQNGGLLHFPFQGVLLVSSSVP